MSPYIGTCRCFFLLHVFHQILFVRRNLHILRTGHFWVPRTLIKQEHILSCENQFYLQESENNFRNEGCALTYNLILIEKPRGNSEMACLFEYVVTLPASSVQLQCSATTKYNYNNTALHFFGRLLSCHCITNIVKLDWNGNAIFAFISKEISHFDVNSAGKWHRNFVHSV